MLSGKIKLLNRVHCKDYFSFPDMATKFVFLSSWKASGNHEKIKYLNRMDYTIGYGRGKWWRNKKRQNHLLTLPSIIEFN